MTDFFGASIIENDVNGIKIKIGDCDALADSIKNLLLNPSIIEKLSKGVVATRIESLHDEIDGIYDFYKVIVGLNKFKSIGFEKYGKDLETNKLIIKETSNCVSDLPEGGHLYNKEQLLLETLSHEPDAPGALHELALLKHQQGVTLQAVDLLEKAMKQDPANSEIANDLGALYYHLGKEDKASELFHRAIELDDKQMDARKNLADLHAAAGRITDAENLYKEILDRHPNDPETLALLEGRSGVNLLSANPTAKAGAVPVSPASTEEPFSLYKEPLIFLQCFFAD